MDGFGAILPIVGAYEESVPPARVRRARGVRMSKPIRFRCASRWWSLVTSGTLRQREHEVEKADGQQFGLALGEPFLGGGGLTLGAMPVAAAVVGNHSMGAVLAARDVAPTGQARGLKAHERHRAAALDGRHHLQLIE